MDIDYLHKRLVDTRRNLDELSLSQIKAEFDFLVDFTDPTKSEPLNVTGGTDTQTIFLTGIVEEGKVRLT